jgi:uncharacterized membrane protein
MKKFLLTLVSLTSPLALADWGMMDGSYGHMNGSGGIGMFLGMGLFWLALIGLGFWAFTYFSKQPKDTLHKTDTAKEIIRARFAKGELTEQEMKSMLEKLD